MVPHRVRVMQTVRGPSFGCGSELVEQYKIPHLEPPRASCADRLLYRDVLCCRTRHTKANYKEFNPNTLRLHHL